MWMVIEALQHGKATSLGIVSGILAGLVVITPAAGVVQPAGAMALAAVASLVCYASIQIKNRMGYDDSLDVFGIHGVAGLLGALLLSFFIRPAWMAEAAAKAGGSWTAWQQLAVQSIGVGLTILYSGLLSLGLVMVVEKTVGFRLEGKLESAGMDSSLHGEHGYGLINLS